MPPGTYQSSQAVSSTFRASEPVRALGAGPGSSSTLNNPAAPRLAPVSPEPSAVGAGRAAASRLITSFGGEDASAPAGEVSSRGPGPAARRWCALAIEGGVSPSLGGVSLTG